MKALLTIILAFLALSQIEAQDRKMIYKLYKKDGKEITKAQLDSMEAIHKVFHFEYHPSPDGLIAVINLITEETKARQKGGFEFRMTEQEDGSFKGSFVGEDALLQKWIGKNIFTADLKDLDNNTYTLGASSDRVTVLNLWYTACGPCIKEMPDLNELVTEFSDDKVDFLALTFDSKEKVTRFLKKRQFDYKVIPEVNEHMAKVWVRSGDEAETISALYPVHFVIDRDGVVQEMILGAKENIRELLQEAIKNQL